MTNDKWKILCLLVALGGAAQAQTVPNPVTIIEPLELPAPRVLRPQFPEFTITLEKAAAQFSQVNPELKQLRERVVRDDSTATALLLAEATRRGILTLKRNFYESVLAHQVAVVTEENLNYLDTYANRMQARWQEKMSPESDVMKWRVERVRVADALAETRLTERLARVQVIQQLGGINSTEYPSFFFYLPDAPAKPLPLTLEQLLATALRHRPEARQPNANLEMLRLRFAAELEGALMSIETHRQRALTLKEQFAPTESLRSVSATFYYEGEAPLLVLLDAQRTRWEVRQQYWRALGAYYISRAELEAALGTSLHEVEP